MPDIPDILGAQNLLINKTDKVPTLVMLTFWEMKRRRQHTSLKIYIDNHLTSIRMTTIKKKKKRTSVGKDVEKLEPRWWKLEREYELMGKKVHFLGTRMESEIYTQRKRHKRE